MNWPWQKNKPQKRVPSRTLWGAADHPRYQLNRESLRQVIAGGVLGEERFQALSPSGRFSLEVRACEVGQRGWEYSRGEVRRVSNGSVIAVVERNYPAFWHCWVEHPDSNEYLLCGEDYQGYSVFNLTQERENVYFPAAGLSGGGFCWASATPSPDGLAVAVEGCHWGGPYEFHLLDFTTPNALPLPELASVEDVGSAIGWRDNWCFDCYQEFEVRASDGKPYDELNYEEQNEVHQDPSLLRTERRSVVLRRPGQQVEGQCPLPRRLVRPSRQAL